MVALIPEIDEKASRDNARDVLREYRRLARMAGRPLVDVKSPTISDMPKAHPFGNGVEIRMTDTFNAQVEINIVDRAMSLLPTQSYWVLFYSYCTPEVLTGLEVAARLGVDNDHIVNYLKRQALMEFAEAYPNQELLTFRH